MQGLIDLVDKHHKFTRNGFRTNLDNDSSNFYFDSSGRKWLKKGPYSNTVRSGPILEHVQTIFPDCTAACLNRKRAESPPMAAHRDKKNEGDSYIAFWGDYDNSNNQGALCLEDGRVFSDKFVFHGPYNGAEIKHWVLPHPSGVRHSAVIFRGPKVYPKGKPLETLDNSKHESTQ